MAIKKIQSALISVYYKDNLEPIIALLKKHGVKIYSTGGTQKFIEEQELLDRFLDFEGSERRSISGFIPGAIIENSIDASHPLTFGLGEKYFSLKTTDSNFKLLKGAQNVIYVPKNYLSFGFIGNKLKKSIEDSVTFAIDYKGSGKVIYMIDNPLFRGFWENGNLLFSNALFLVD